ncbi:MAG TPA: GFA family protein [Steroidobacteraceae bacterium]|nr:GFA family protein [Steroidobacteraceae bacterium]
MHKTLTGGCFCGQIRYEATGTPFHETNCHCAICRGTTGAPSVAWFSVERPSFRFTAGEPKRFKSTRRGTRAFCPTCGTQLTFETEDFPTEVDVTICSLDDPDGVRPKDQTWVSSKLRWTVLDARLPQHRTSAQGR